MKLVVLGAPGAGKGTQGRNIAKLFNIVHISTGDMLRAEIANKTKIGLEIEDRMDKGILVPDELITELLTKRLLSDECKDGFILDGYPRNLSQAKLLDQFLNNSIDKVISVDVPDAVILERMTGRYMCSVCNTVYHLHYHPPKVPFVCDVCGGQLIQRDDDKKKTVLHRVETYHEVTEPIKNYYREQGLLLEVIGTNDIKEITDFIVKALGRG